MTSALTFNPPIHDLAHTPARCNDAPEDAREADPHAESKPEATFRPEVYSALNPSATPFLLPRGRHGHIPGRLTLAPDGADPLTAPCSTPTTPTTSRPCAPRLPVLRRARAQRPPGPLRGRRPRRAGHPQHHQVPSEGNVDAASHSCLLGKVSEADVPFYNGIELHLLYPSTKVLRCVFIIFITTPRSFAIDDVVRQPRVYRLHEKVVNKKHTRHGNATVFNIAAHFMPALFNDALRPLPAMPGRPPRSPCPSREIFARSLCPSCRRRARPHPGPQAAALLRRLLHDVTYGQSPDASCVPFTAGRGLGSQATAECVQSIHKVVVLQQVVQPEVVHCLGEVGDVLTAVVAESSDLSGQLMNRLALHRTYYLVFYLLEPQQVHRVCKRVLLFCRQQDRSDSAVAKARADRYGRIR
ncbi:unnamed protein product [Sphagnum tenellum]